MRTDLSEHAPQTGGGHWESIAQRKQAQGVELFQLAVFVVDTGPNYDGQTLSDQSTAVFC